MKMMMLLLLPCWRTPGSAHHQGTAEVPAVSHICHDPVSWWGHSSTKEMVRNSSLPSLPRCSCSAFPLSSGHGCCHRSYRLPCLAACSLSSPWAPRTVTQDSSNLSSISLPVFLSTALCLECFLIYQRKEYYCQSLEYKALLRGTQPQQ